MPIHPQLHIADGAYHVRRADQPTTVISVALFASLPSTDTLKA
jgi:hypothetical protein